jgi:hypothetical protein
MGGLAPVNSESLLGQLSHEASGLRSRATQIVRDLGRCQHPALCARLERELQLLRCRRDAIRQLCLQLRCHQAWHDSLSLELVEELCRRPLVSP